MRGVGAEVMPASRATPPVGGAGRRARCGRERRTLLRGVGPAASASARTDPDSPARSAARSSRPRIPRARGGASLAARDPHREPIPDSTSPRRLPRLGREEGGARLDGSRVETDVARTLSAALFPSLRPSARLPRSSARTSSGSHASRNRSEEVRTTRPLSTARSIVALRSETSVRSRELRPHRGIAESRSWSDLRPARRRLRWTRTSAGILGRSFLLVGDL